MVLCFTQITCALLPLSSFSLSVPFTRLSPFCRPPCTALVTFIAAITLTEGKGKPSWFSFSSCLYQTSAGARQQSQRPSIRPPLVSVPRWCRWWVDFQRREVAAVCMRAREVVRGHNCVFARPMRVDGGTRCRWPSRPSHSCAHLANFAEHIIPCRAAELVCDSSTRRSSETHHTFLYRR